MESRASRAAAGPGTAQRSNAARRVFAGRGLRSSAAGGDRSAACARTEVVRADGEGPFVDIERLRQRAKQQLPEPARDLLRHLIVAKRRWLPRARFSFPTAPEIPHRSAYAFPISSDNPLEELCAKYLPSKRLHNYIPYYWMHFRDIRFEVGKVLEIGVQTDRSIRMWEAFFPNATIYGADIDPACERLAGGRCEILIGDQSDPAFLRRLVDRAGGHFDIVIDDGSHRVEHQLASFDFLFPLLSDHGIYAVEDTGGCVGDSGLATVNALEALVDHVMYWPKGFRPADWPHLDRFPRDASWADRNTIGIAFYRWLVFVMRGNNPGDNPHLTPLPSVRGNA